MYVSYVSRKDRFPKLVILNQFFTLIQSIMFQDHLHFENIIRHDTKECQVDVVAKLKDNVKSSDQSM